MTTLDVSLLNQNLLTRELMKREPSGENEHPLSGWTLRLMTIERDSTEFDELFNNSEYKEMWRKGRFGG